MVTLPFSAIVLKIRHCHVCIAKKTNHVLKNTRSQGNWYPQPHSETTWLPGIPTSLFLAIRTDHRTIFLFYFIFFVGMNVNCHSTRRCIWSVHECVRASVFQARHKTGPRSYRAVNL